MLPIYIQELFQTINASRFCVQLEEKLEYSVKISPSVFGGRTTSDFVKYRKGRFCQVVSSQMSHNLDLMSVSKL